MYMCNCNDTTDITSNCWLAVYLIHGLVTLNVYIHIGVNKRRVFLVVVSTMALYDEVYQRNHSNLPHIRHKCAISYFILELVYARSPFGVSDGYN